MARKSRTVSPTGIYHVMSRGNNKEKIFEKDYEKEKMRKIIKESKEKYSVEIYAYCIMSNHFHILMRIPFQQLPEFMRDIKLQYSKNYNWKYQRVGHVFQGPYRSEAIDTEAYFWSCLRYIHLNPVKAGMEKSFYHYRYSSGREYYKNKPILLHEYALRMIKNNFTDFREFEDVHKVADETIFEDIDSDTEVYIFDIIRHIILDYQTTYHFNNSINLIEIPQYRDKIIKELTNRLKISKNRASKLVEKYRIVLQFNFVPGAF